MGKKKLSGHHDGSWLSNNLQLSSNLQPLNDSSKLHIYSVWNYALAIVFGLPLSSLLWNTDKLFPHMDIRIFHHVFCIYSDCICPTKIQDTWFHARPEYLKSRMHRHIWILALLQCKWGQRLPGRRCWPPFILLKRTEVGSVVFIQWKPWKKWFLLEFIKMKSLYYK
jgi:hypothetical protein